MNWGGVEREDISEARGTGAIQYMPARRRNVAVVVTLCSRLFFLFVLVMAVSGL